MEAEKNLIREALEKVFKGRIVTKDGRKITFKPIKGEVERAIVEWIKVRGEYREVIEVIRTSLKEGFGFKKIADMTDRQKEKVQSFKSILRCLFGLRF